MNSGPVETSCCMNPNMIGYLRSADRDERLPMRMGELLAIRFTGIHGKGADGLEFRGYATMDGDVMIGITRDVHDDRHPWETNLAAYLNRIVLGAVTVPPVPSPMLPDLHRKLLEHDGFSGNGAEAVARALGRVALNAGKRRHILKFKSGQPRSGEFIREEWAQLQIDLGAGVVAMPSGLILRNPLPDSVAVALPGRRASDAVEHPVLDRYRILSVQARKKGQTITLEFMDG